MTQPDDLDRLVLNELQTDFPLVAEPFDAIGERVGLRGAAVLERVAQLKEQGVLRQVSAIFDSRQLGYRSSLVAMAFAPGDLEAGAAVINQHPGVSHNYQREHRYNLWFTIAVPPSKAVEGEVAALAERARPEQTRLLPTLRLFKIGVNLDVTGQTAITATEAESVGHRPAADWLREVEPPRLTAEELTAIRLLQRDLPLVARPFDSLTDGSSLTAGRLFALAQAMLADGRMRRYAAVLHHRQAGFRYNAMGVWVASPERIDEVGTKMAEFKAVSHCYHRPTYPDWPYSLFTMIHGREPGDCEAVAAAISQATGITEYGLLSSTREFKKTRVRYFVDDDAFDVASLPVRG